jgi:hypothetical protein
MAKKRTLDRRTLRDQAEAAEAKEKDEKDEAEEEEEEEEEEDGGDDEGGGDDDEEGGSKKKKKPKAKPKAKEKKPAAKKPSAKRTRTPKEVRLKAVWVVFDNASKRVDTFPFKDKKEAEALLEKKLQDKGTFYLSLVKEPFEE